MTTINMQLKIFFVNFHTPLPTESIKLLSQTPPVCLRFGLYTSLIAIWLNWIHTLYNILPILKEAVSNCTQKSYNCEKDMYKYVKIKFTSSYKYIKVFKWGISGIWWIPFTRPHSR